MPASASRRRRVRDVGRPRLTFGEAALHFEEAVFHRVLGAVDDLAAVLAHVLHGDVSDHQRGVPAVTFPQVDAVFVPSEGPGSGSQGEQRLLRRSSGVFQLGPFDPDAGAGSFGQEPTRQGGVAAEVGKNPNWKKTNKE